MKTITKVRKYGLKKSTARKTEIIGDEGRNPKIFSKFQSIKKNNVEDVCTKLKNDLKWYWDDMLNYNFRQNERNQENILTKEFSEKTVSKLVEEWWLGS
jgi:hypothetical protein